MLLPSQSAFWLSVVIRVLWICRSNLGRFSCWREGPGVHPTAVSGELNGPLSSLLWGKVWLMVTLNTDTSFLPNVTWIVLSFKSSQRGGVGRWGGVCVQVECVAYIMTASYGYLLRPDALLNLGDGGRSTLPLYIWKICTQSNLKVPPNWWSHSAHSSQRLEITFSYSHSPISENFYFFFFWKEGE